MTIQRISFALLCALAWFTPLPVAADPFDDLFDLIRSTVRAEARLPWTDIFYAGSPDLGAARNQCLKKFRHNGRSEIPPEFRQVGWGPECVIGASYSRNERATPGALGAPVTSCATLTGFASSILGQQAVERLYQGQGSALDMRKANAYDLVQTVMEIEDALRFYKIDPSLWQSSLNAFESGLRKDLGIKPAEFKVRLMTALNGFVDALNERRQGSTPKLASIMGCGGGIFPFYALVKPAAAIVEIIPKMFFSYCRDKGIDVNDKSACRHFLTDIKNEETVWLSGVYLYRVVNNGQKGAFKEIDVGRKLKDARNLIARGFGNPESTSDAEAASRIFQVTFQ